MSFNAIDPLAVNANDGNGGRFPKRRRIDELGQGYDAMETDENNGDHTTSSMATPWNLATTAGQNNVGGDPTGTARGSSSSSSSSSSTNSNAVVSMQEEQQPETMQQEHQSSQAPRTKPSIEYCYHCSCYYCACRVVAIGSNRVFTSA